MLNSSSPPLAPRPDADPLLAWRQHTVALLVRLFIVLLAPLGLIDAANHIRLGHWPMALYHVAACLLVIGLSRACSHNHRLRGLTIVGYFLISCLISLSAIGLYSIAPGLMFIAVVMAVLLLDRQASIAFIALGLSGVAVILSGFGLGLLPYPQDPPQHATEWPVLLNNILLITGLSTMLALTIGSLVTALQTSLQTTQDALAELERVNTSLEATLATSSEDLRHSRSLLQAVLDHSPVAIYVKDLDGRYLLTNRYMHRVHSLSSTEMEGQRDSDLFGATAEPWRAHERAVVDADQPVAAEMVTPHGDGRHLYYEIKFPLHDTTGTISAIGGIAVDITARKETELALAAQLRYAEALARCSRILLTPLDDEETFRQALGEALTIVREAVGGEHLHIARYTGPGTSMTNLVRSFQVLATSNGPGLPPQRAPTPEELADMPPALNVWRQRGGSFNGPVAGLLSAHPLFKRYNDDNQIQSAFIQALNVAGRWWGHVKVTDHQQARSWDAGAVQLIRTAAEMIVTFTEGWEAAQALQEREAVLREVGQMAEIGGWSLDRATLTLQWSEQVYAIHELPVTSPPSTEESLGFYDPEARPALHAAILACVREGTSWDLELPLITAKGRRIWVRAQGQAAYAGGTIVRIRGTIQAITARKEAQLALAASEAKYRTLFALLPTGVTLADESGRIVEVNPAAERLLGIGANYHCARRSDDLVWDIIQPDGSPFPVDALPSIRAPREGQVIADVEMGVGRPDGERTWLSVSAAPLLLAPYKVVVAYTDITARKVAELALAAELRYAEALARCSRILLVTGADAPTWEQVVQQALATLREAAGCTRLELSLFPLANEPFQLPALRVADQHPEAAPFQYLPVDRADITPALMEAMQRGEVVGGSVDDLFPPLSTLHAQFRANQIRSVLLAGVQIGGTWRGYAAAGDGRATHSWDEPVVRMLRTGLEMITAFINQWETASTLRAREAQLRAVGDNLPNGCIFQLHLTPPWQIKFTYLSSGVERMLGVPPEEGLRDADAIARFVLPEDVERLKVVTQRATADGDDINEAVRYTLADRAERWLYLCARPQPKADGSAVWDGVALDITERQQAAEELTRARDVAEAATRAKSAFLANMSHEIRTPLNAVIGMATLLRETALNDEQRVFADTIHSGGQALLAVISDILDFSRIEAGHVEPEAAPFDLPACLGSAVDLIAHAAREKGLAVRYSRAPELPKAVVGDAGHLRQVLLNLLGNAVKFTSQGEISISATAVPQDEQITLVTITVSDTGIGISQEQLGRIFAPFVQANNSTARRYGGTGLGLAISQQLVTIMGGTIDVASAPELGSTFIVRLPFQLASVAPPAPKNTPVSAAARPLHVLVAEDNPVNQEVVRRMLGRLGHSATVVADGQAAVEAVAQGSYDVVLMDVQMPVLDGEAATRQIRRRGASIVQPYIIALTANALDVDRERALQAGMDDYLSKPVLLAELHRALAQVTRGEAVERGPDDAGPRVPVPEPLIEWTALEQMLTSLGPASPAATVTVLRIFEEALPPQLDVIESTLAQGNLAQLRRAAHRLRGGCRQLGALALAALCDQLEHTNTIDEAAILAARLRPCYEETRDLLRRRYTEG